MWSSALLVAAGLVGGYTAAWIQVWAIVRDRAPRKHRLEMK